ncbi:MAG: hypothetical protein JNK94_05270 [Hyphomonadaceae bacterium]|nr:hypothetical protein [Hyphomonadaceae bacterium]MBX3511862.1 hypothetical protein [Hyphomonadaceae bacterium]
MLRNTLLAAALIALSACASTETSGASQAAPADRDCFRNADIFSYGVIDNYNVRVRARGHDYIFTTNWNARDLDWTQAIAVRSVTGWICTGNGLGVEIIGGEPRRTYPIVSIARAPEEPAPTGS